MKESTYWSWHILAAIVMMVVLTIHMGVMHLDNLMLLLGYGYEDILSFQSVLERSKSTYYLIIYLLLLAAALYHGLYGFRTILSEMTMLKKFQLFFKIIIPFGGVLLFAYGAYAIIVGFTKLGG